MFGIGLFCFQCKLVLDFARTDRLYHMHLPTTDHRVFTDYRLPTTDHRLLTTDYLSPQLDRAANHFMITKINGMRAVVKTFKGGIM